MIGTRKISVRFKQYLVPFPFGKKQHYTLNCSSRISVDSNDYYPNSIREVKVTYSKDEEKYFIIIQTLSLKLFLDKDANRNRKIAELLASVYSTLRLRVKPDGSTIAIDNLEEIDAQWKQIKKELNYEYKGLEIKRLINGLDIRFSNENLILEEILEYTFFGLLLNPIFQHYNTEMTKSMPRVLKWGDRKITIEEYLILHDIDEADARIWILLDKKKQSDGISLYKGYYELNTDTFCLNKAELIIGTAEKDKKYTIKKTR